MHDTVWTSPENIIVVVLCEVLFVILNPPSPVIVTS